MFCVNNTDQKDRQPLPPTGAVWQEKQMLLIVRDRSKPTPIVRDRPKPTIQRSKTAFTKIPKNIIVECKHSSVSCLGVTVKLVAS